MIKNLLFNPVADKIVVEAGQKVTASDFLRDKDQDITLITKISPDMLNTLGEYEIILTLNDKEYESKLVVQDTIVPTADSKDVEIYETEEIKPEMFVSNIKDATQVKISFEKEPSNTQIKKTTVTVVAPQINVASLEAVYAKADAVLKKIITKSMTKKEKCKKMYNWVHSNVGYINSSDKSSWIKGAMHAFENHKGDCFNYFAITKALLTRVGIENINLKVTKHTHYWNFVKVEGG